MSKSKASPAPDAASTNRPNAGASDARVAALEQQWLVSRRAALRWRMLFFVTVLASGVGFAWNVTRHVPAVVPTPAPGPDTARIAAAEQAANAARSRELACRATTQILTDPELAILLALEADSVARTPQAEEALRDALVHYPLRTTWHGHKQPVRDVAFSPDGKWLAAASLDHTASLRDLASGRRVAEMTHDDEVFTVAFSPESHRLITSSEDRTARVWAVPGGQNVAVLRGHELNVCAASFSPDGRYARNRSRVPCSARTDSGL